MLHLLRHLPGPPDPDPHHTFYVMDRAGKEVEGIRLVVFSVAHHLAIMLDPPDFALQLGYIDAVAETIHRVALCLRRGKLHRFQLHEESGEHGAAFRVQQVKVRGALSSIPKGLCRGQKNAAESG